MFNLNIPEINWRQRGPKTRIGSRDLGEIDRLFAHDLRPMARENRVGKPFFFIYRYS